MEFQCRVIVQRRRTSCCSSVENIPLQAERHSARRQKLFAFPPESAFTFRPECCSESQRNDVQLQTGIAFTFDRIPQLGDGCVSNCWLSTPNNLGADSLPYTSCSGSDCEDSGRNGRSLSSWLHPEPLSAGMAPAFGCIGNGSPELDRPVAEKLSAKRFVR